MTQTPTIVTRVLLGLYGSLWAGGILTYALGMEPPSALSWTAPVYLLLAAVLVALGGRRSEWPVLAVALSLGLISEFVGVATGLPFGRYDYTTVLAPRIAGVPIVMACAWIILIAYVRQLTAHLVAGHALRVIIGAAWMVAIDLVIDPLAAGPLNYWRWFDTGPWYGIPTLNFAGWFVVSAAILVVAPRPAAAAPLVRWIGVSVVAFFTAIAFALGLVAAGAVGLALVATHVVVTRWVRG